MDCEVHPHSTALDECATTVLRQLCIRQRSDGQGQARVKDEAKGEEDKIYFGYNWVGVSGESRSRSTWNECKELLGYDQT